MVLRIVFGEHEVLLAADIGSETEQELLATGQPLESDILKVPHHGSRGSSSTVFLDQVKPAWAVFTVGVDPRWGSPHDEIIERYEWKGIRILRTDIHGAITFRTDGRDIEIETFLNSEQQEGTPSSPVSHPAE